MDKLSKKRLLKCLPKACYSMLRMEKRTTFNLLVLRVQLLNDSGED